MAQRNQHIEETEEVVILPVGSRVRIDFKEVLDFRELIWLFTKQELIYKYKQTIFGPLWAVMTPLFSSVIFTLVFGNFAGMATDGVPHFLFYLAGNSLWSLFTTTFNGTSNLFIERFSLFSKIYFPRLTIPLSKAFSALINFFIQLTALLAFYLYYYATGQVPALSWNALWLLPLLLQCLIIGMGLGSLVSTLSIKYRDLSFMAPYLLQIWMYLTPIVYPLSSTGGYMRIVLLLNPMTAVLNNFKFALLATGEFLGANWVYSWAFTLAAGWVGLVMYNRVEKTFIDTI